VIPVSHRMMTPASLLELETSKPSQAHSHTKRRKEKGPSLHVPRPALPVALVCVCLSVCVHQELIDFFTFWLWDASDALC